MNDRKWWEEEGGTCVCHLCKEPVDPTSADAMFGLSGAPVHGDCGQAALGAGKVVALGKRPRHDVPVTLEGRVVGSATLHTDEHGIRAEMRITDADAADALSFDVSDLSIGEQEEEGS